MVLSNPPTLKASGPLHAKVLLFSQEDANELESLANGQIANLT